MPKFNETDLALCTTIATEILGWEVSGNRWFGTKFKVATTPRDKYELGFFRPDSHYVCTKILLDRIRDEFGVEHTIKWQGLKGTYTFVVGDKKYEVKKIDFRMGNLALAKTGLVVYRELKRAEKLRRTRLQESETDS